MLRSRGKDFSPSVWNEKSIRNGLDMPTEQMMSYSWLRGRKTERYLLQYLQFLSRRKIACLERSKENISRRKLVKRLSINSVLLEIHPGSHD